MTLDEAIGHANKKACGNGRCAEEYAQLADWLCELRISRIKIELLKTIRDGFKTDAEYYKAENAKLRELANAVKDFCEDFTCDDCAMRRDCADNGRLFCDTPNFHALDAMRKALRELGIEVD